MLVNIFSKKAFLFKSSNIEVNNIKTNIGFLIQTKQKPADGLTMIKTIEL